MRAFELAHRSFRSNESVLITQFRNFLKRMSAAGAEKFRDESFLRQLRALASARNAVAHIGATDADELYAIAPLVLDGKSKGVLLAELHNIRIVESGVTARLRSSS